MTIPTRRHPYAGVMLLAAIGLPGCGKGDPDALSTVPAAGTITFLDKPIAKGTIRLVPEKGRPAGGTIENGRFTLGIGSGERLNEHIVGKGFPGVHERQAMLREALEIINLLWQGGYQNYDGRYLRLEDARVFDLPERLPLIAVAAGGPQAARLAAELGTALFATEPRPDLIEAYTGAGGSGPRYAEAPLAWAPDEKTAAQAALETTRWSLTGWKVMSELPNPVNFEAATTTVRLDDVMGQFACGPDPERHLEVAGQFLDAGFDRIALLNAGPDPDGFIEFFRTELGDRLRARAS